MDSGPRLTPRAMVAGVKKLIADWEYDVVSLGVPAPVVRGRVVAEPANLAKGLDWLRFRGGLRLSRQGRQRCRDAGGWRLSPRQVCSSWASARASAPRWSLDGNLEPLEVAHLPYRKGRTFEDYVGRRGLERLGKKRWRKHVSDRRRAASRAFLPRIWFWAAATPGTSRPCPRARGWAPTLTPSRVGSRCGRRMMPGHWRWQQFRHALSSPTPRARDTVPADPGRAGADVVLTMFDDGGFETTLSHRRHAVTPRRGREPAARRPRTQCGGSCARPRLDRRVTVAQLAVRRRSVRSNARSGAACTPWCCPLRRPRCSSWAVTSWDSCGRRWCRSGYASRPRRTRSSAGRSSGPSGTR